MEEVRSDIFTVEALSGKKEIHLRRVFNELNRAGKKLQGGGSKRSFTKVENLFYQAYDIIDNIVKQIKIEAADEGSVIRLKKICNQNKKTQSLSIL